MTLSDLWQTLAGGNRGAVQAAYLHRAMRERGGVLFKGRFDVDADWELVLGAGGECIIIADLGDMAVVRLGDAVWHHWVRREAGRIAFEVLIADEGDLGDESVVVERSVTVHGQTAELFHLFSGDESGAQRRSVGSRIMDSAHAAISAAFRNG